MFAKLFNFECSVSLSKRFFDALAALQKRGFFLVQREPIFFLVACAAALYNFGIVTIMLVNTEKCLKFHRFESEQNLFLFRFEIYSLSI